jgi:ATP-binding cassette subfamily F protein 3
VAYRGRREGDATVGQPEAAKNIDRKEQRRAAAEHRQRLQPLSSRLRALEARMAQLGRAKHDLEQALAEPQMYVEASKERLKETLRHQARLVQELDDAEQEWLELSEELESLAGG